MKHGLHPVWCEGCGGVSLMGGPVAVARVVGVDRRTIRNWCVSGQIHARPLRHQRWEVCACSACGETGGGGRCGPCRKIFREKWDNRGMKLLDWRHKGTEGYR